MTFNPKHFCFLPLPLRWLVLVIGLLASCYAESNLQVGIAEDSQVTPEVPPQKSSPNASDDLADTNRLSSLPTVTSGSGQAGLPPESVSIVSLLEGKKCFDMHAPDTEPSLGLYSCNGTTGQKWNLDANNLLRFTGESKVSPSGLCVAPASTATNGGGNVLVEPCSGQADQEWLVQGPRILHKMSGLCVGIANERFVSSDNIGFDRITLSPCNPNLKSQQWYFGDDKSAYSYWVSKDANSTVEEKCFTEIVLGNYVASDPNTKRLVGRYGSIGAMLAFIRTAATEDCAQMYFKGSEVPPRERLTVHFWPKNRPLPESTPAATVGRTPLGETLHFYTPFWGTVDEVEMPFTLRIDATIHHEVAHTLDLYYYGKPASIIEGYANLIVHRTGYIPLRDKKKGGAWTDGYSPTAFFLKWLDETFEKKPRPNRFTDLMQAQARLQAEKGAKFDPDWFLPWVKQQTGFTIDQLWAKYQASF